MKAVTVYQTSDNQYFANEELANQHEVNLVKDSEQRQIILELQENEVKALLEKKIQDEKAKAVELAQLAIEEKSRELEDTLKDELNEALITAKAEPQSQFMIDAVGVLETLLGNDVDSDDEDYSSSEDYYDSNCY